MIFTLPELNNFTVFAGSKMAAYYMKFMKLNLNKKLRVLISRHVYEVIIYIPSQQYTSKLINM